jgi:hypothetical protein
LASFFSLSPGANSHDLMRKDVVGEGAISAIG